MGTLLQKGNTYLERELFSKTGTHFYRTGALLQKGNTSTERKRLFETPEKCSNNATLGIETPSGPLRNWDTSLDWEHPCRTGTLIWNKNYSPKLELFTKMGTHFYRTGTLLQNGNAPLEQELPSLRFQRSVPTIQHWGKKHPLDPSGMGTLLRNGNIPCRTGTLIWNGNYSPKQEHTSTVQEHFSGMGTPLWNGNASLRPWECFSRDPLPEKCFCSTGVFPFQRSVPVPEGGSHSRGVQRVFLCPMLHCCMQQM